MKNVCILFFTFFTSAMMAQVPGYLGKKVSISYDPAVFVSFKDIGNQFENLSALGINYRHDINAEMILSKSISIAPSFKYLSEKVPNSMIYDSYIDSTTGEDARIAFLGNLKIKSKGYGFELKNYQFKKYGSIAPIGSYYSIAFVYLKSKVEGMDYSNELDELTYFANIETSKYVEFEEVADINEIYNSYVFIFGKGTQRAIGTNFLLDITLELGLSLNSILSYEAYLGNKSGEISTTNDLNEIIDKRILSAYFLNLKFGIGTFVF